MLTTTLLLIVTFWIVCMNYSSLARVERKIDALRRETERRPC
jgi:hypothetical protein